MTSPWPESWRRQPVGSVLVGSLLAVLGCGNDPAKPTASPPTASFVVTPPAGWTDTEFRVDAASSSAPVDPVSALAVRWDWEDDGTWDTGWSTDKVATHVYATATQWTIRLQARDTDGQTDDTTRDVDVAHNERPETQITAWSPDLLFGYRVQVSWRGADADGHIARFWIGWDDPANLQPTSDADSLFDLSCTGEHVFHVAAEDDAGRLDLTPASLRVAIPHAFFTSEEAMVQALALAYRDRDPTLFTGLLASEPQSNAEFLYLLGEPTNTGEIQWGYHEEIRIHSRMFRPEAPAPGDPPVPPELWIRGLSVNLTALEGFSERPDLYSQDGGADGKLDPARWRATDARYRHSLFLDLSGDTDYRIEGTSNFIVIENFNKAPGDVGKFLFYLWEDVNEPVHNGVVESTTWSAFKSLYR